MLLLVQVGLPMMNTGEAMLNADAMRMVGVCLFVISVVQVCIKLQKQSFRNAHL